MTMEVEANIEFKCPECFRMMKVPFKPDAVRVVIESEPCPEHGSHDILMLGMNCPNCHADVILEIISDSETPGEEEIIFG